MLKKIKSNRSFLPVAGELLSKFFDQHKAETLTPHKMEVLSYLMKCLNLGVEICCQNKYFEFSKEDLKEVQFQGCLLYLDEHQQWKAKDKHCQVEFERLKSEEFNYKLENLIYFINHEGITLDGYEHIDREMCQYVHMGIFVEKDQPPCLMVLSTKVKNKNSSESLAVSQNKRNELFTLYKQYNQWADQQRVLDKEYTIENFAQLHNITAHTLRRHFNDIVGVSVMAYRRFEIMNEIFMRVLTTNCSINELAKEFGYSEVRHMRRAFDLWSTVPLCECFNLRQEFLEKIMEP